jgi:hypothetical protein
VLRLGWAVRRQFSGVTFLILLGKQLAKEIGFTGAADPRSSSVSALLRPELYRWWCSVAIWWCHIALTRGFIVGEAALVVTNNSS